jgi:hypothetical protein
VEACWWGGSSHRVAEVSANKAPKASLQDLEECHSPVEIPLNSFW